MWLTVWPFLFMFDFSFVLRGCCCMLFLVTFFSLSLIQLLILALERPFIFCNALLSGVYWALAFLTKKGWSGHWLGLVFFLFSLVPSVLWRCWLGGRKGIRPVKNRLVGIGVVICLEWGADLHMAQLMPLPCTVSCSSKIQIGFTFLVPAYPGCPGKEAVKW